MKRELDKKERELTEKGIEKNEQKIIELQNEHDYNRDAVLFNRKWRNYLRDLKDKKDDSILENLKEQIEMVKKNIELGKQQLKEGVNIKKPTGV